MRNPTCKSLAIALICLSLTSCVNSGPKVELMKGPEAQITCDQAQNMDTRQIPEDDFYMILDQAAAGHRFEACWKDTMARSLEQGRNIPVKHLALAVHEFNRRQTQDVFFLVAYQYFTKIIQGQERYGHNQKALLNQYVSLAITKADNKQEMNLKKAMLVCERLDQEMYNKLFNN